MINLEDKKITTKEFCITVFIIVAVIAFLETPAFSLLTWEFWKEFLLKVIIYTAAAELVVIFVASSNK